MKLLTTRIALALLAAFATTAIAQEAPALEQVIERYVEARGGAERWSRVQSIELEGIYAAFSDHEPFKMVRGPENLYRLDFKILGGEAVRARDADGPWWVHPLLQPQAARLTEDPYKTQVERESLFGPLLLDYADKGIGVALVGPGDVEGIPVIELSVSLPGGGEETWYLDAESHLEVAVDSQVSDYTQSPEPMPQRTFFDDFRDVDGVMLPFRQDHEFGHRLESMTVEKAEVVSKIDPGRFSPPKAEAGAEADAEPDSAEE